MNNTVVSGHVRNSCDELNAHYASSPTMPAYFSIEEHDLFYHDTFEDLKTQSSTNNFRGSNLITNQAPDFNDAYKNDYYDCGEDYDDDTSSFTSILDAFTDALATPPSMSWESSNDRPTAINDDYLGLWNLRATVKDTIYHAEQPHYHSKFTYCPIHSSTPAIKTIGEQKFLNKKNSSSHLSTSSSSYYSAGNKSFGLPKITSIAPLHRTTKSWPNRLSNSTSLSLLTHQEANKSFSGKLSSPMGPKSRDSDLSTCATLVSTSPIHSMFEQKNYILNVDRTTINKSGENGDQFQTSELNSQTRPGIFPESERSIWDSDDDDDDANTVQYEGTFTDIGLNWPRLGRIQMREIKRKFRIGTSHVHQNENMSRNSKWQEAVKKSVGGKKSMTNTLREILRLKIPTLE